MLKALSVIVLFGAAVFCFWRAYRIQVHRSVDGIVRRPQPYAAMRLWVIAGTGFLLFGFVALAAATDPGFLNIGKH